MNDDSTKSSAGSFNTAQVDEHKSPKVSVVWLVPIIATVLGAALLINDYLNQGTKITIQFKNAQNLVAGKTKIKYLNIDIGEIKSITLNDDDSGVIATARLDQGVKHLLVEDSKFWIVKPRIGVGGISGLDTLLSGAYLGLIPGRSENSTNSFVGIDGIPPAGKEEPGRRLSLRSNSSQLLGEGTSIFYRGYPAGSIEKVELNLLDSATYYEVFIRSPYDQLITKNTRFWDISGVSFEYSPDGFQLHANSIESILSGSLTFGLAEEMEAGEMAQDGELFILYPNKAAANALSYSTGLNIITSFDSSLRGLTVGAAVEFRGLKMGHVTAIDKERSVTSKDGQSYVTIRLEPGRIGFTDSDEGATQLKNKIESWVSNGLHASLTAGSLLVGKNFVELNFPNKLEGRALTTKPEVAYIDGLLSVPTYTNGLGAVKDKVLGILNRTESLPIGDLVNDASKLIKNLENASSELESILAAPATKQLPENMNNSLSQLDETLSGFSSDKELYQDIEQTVYILNQSLLDLDQLLKKLKDKPNALIFNSKANPKVIPKSGGK